MKDELIKKAGFSSTYEKDRLYTLINLTVQQCLELVENTPSHCAHTTYDLSVVECTIQKSLDQITEQFNLPRKAKKSNERIMGREVSTKDY